MFSSAVVLTWDSMETGSLLEPLLDVRGTAAFGASEVEAGRLLMIPINQQPSLS